QGIVPSSPQEVWIRRRAFGISVLGNFSLSGVRKKIGVVMSWKSHGPPIVNASRPRTWTTPPISGSLLNAERIAEVQSNQRFDSTLLIGLLGRHLCQT